MTPARENINSNTNGTIFEDECTDFVAQEKKNTGNSTGKFISLLMP